MDELDLCDKVGEGFGGNRSAPNGSELLLAVVADDGPTDSEPRGDQGDLPPKSSKTELLGSKMLSLPLPPPTLSDEGGAEEVEATSTRPEEGLWLRR